MRCLPERGRIGIFNRSYYEEVLVVRIHPEFLDRQRLPVMSSHLWAERFEDINAHELHLARNGTVIRKILPQRFAGGAGAAICRAAARPGQELEILRCRPEGAAALE